MHYSNMDFKVIYSEVFVTIFVGGSNTAWPPMRVESCS